MKDKKIYKLLKKSNLFDKEWYLEKNPDVKKLRVDPLLHYVVVGWKEGRAPSARFDGARYLATYPDVLADGMNPLFHFETSGRDKGYRCFALYESDGNGVSSLNGFPGVRRERLEYNAIKNSPWFNAEWYLDTYQDVARAGADPVEHYYIFGWKEGRNPGPDFSTADYLREYPDVKAANVCPLSYYELEGRREGRSIPRHVPFDLVAVCEDFRLRPKRDVARRILLVTHSLSDKKEAEGLLKTSAALQTLGYQSMLLSPENGRFRREFEMQGIPVIVSADPAMAMVLSSGCVAAIVFSVLLHEFFSSLSMVCPTVWGVWESRLDIEKNTDLNAQLSTADNVLFLSELDFFQSKSENRTTREETCENGQKPNTATLQLAEFLEKSIGNAVTSFQTNDYNLIKHSVLFDAEYYRNVNGDITDKDIDPVSHYLFHGWKEGRSPSLMFDGAAYLQCYPDVAKSNINPLLHFEKFGRRENLKTFLCHEYRREPFVSAFKNIDCIDKAEVDREISAFKSSFRSPRVEKTKFVVSMTSFPERIRLVHYAVFSVLRQTHPPDVMVLWLVGAEFPQKEKDLPTELLDLCAKGLTIRWCDKNLKSYLKLIPAITAFSDDVIITVDDDIFYPPQWLENLLETHTQYPMDIVAHRAHRVAVDSDFEILPYTTWEMNIGDASNPSFFNFLTGCGGVLYPPGALHSSVLDEERFMTLCPNADDVWFWAMALLNNRKIRVSQHCFTRLIYVTPERDLGENDDLTLAKMNVASGGNDAQLEKVLNAYPLVKARLQEEREAIKVSVVVPVYNSQTRIEECIRSLMNQSLKEIEIICVDDGSTDRSVNALESLALEDARIRIFSKENGGVHSARNLGMRKALGEYIGFVDNDDYVDTDFFEKLYHSAVLSNADIAKAGYKYVDTIDGSIKDAELNQLIREKAVSGELMTMHEHTVVVWTQIYRRGFVEAHDIYFEHRFAEDTFFIVKANYFANKIVPVLGTYYYFVQHGDGFHNKYWASDANVKKWFQSQFSIVEFINTHEISEEDYLSIYQRSFRRVVQLLSTFGRECTAEPLGTFALDFYSRCKHKDLLQKRLPEIPWKTFNEQDVKALINFFRNKFATTVHNL